MKKWMNIVENYGSPDYLYHGTSRRHLESIYEDGLLEPSYWGTIEIARDYMEQYSDGILIRKPFRAFVEDGLDVNENLIDISDEDGDTTPPQTWQESYDQLDSVVYNYIMPVDEDDIYDLYD